MNYIDALKVIKSGKPYPIYVIVGEEDYLREEAINILIKRFIDKNTIDFNLDILRGEDIDGQLLYNRLISFPLMSEKRCVLLKGAGELNADGKKGLKMYVENTVESTVLIIESDKVNTREKVFSELKNKSFWFEFKRLYRRQLSYWIVNYIVEKGKKISKEGVETLIEMTNSSLRDITNEIEKEILYMGERRIINKEDILEITGGSKLYNIFELMNAVGSKNLTRSLKIVDKMLERGEKPSGIIVMLSRHITLLLKVKEYKNRFNEDEISKKLNIRKYFMKDYLIQSENFSDSEFERCFNYLLHSDILAKRGVKNVKLLMNILIYLITGSEVSKNEKIFNSEEDINKKLKIFRELSEVYLVR